MTYTKALAILLITIIALATAFLVNGITARAAINPTENNSQTSLLNSNLVKSNITQLWNFTLVGESPKSPPVFSDGRLYMDVSGDYAYAYCLNAVNGNQVWNFSLGKATGLTFGPVLANGYVYAGASIVLGNSSNYFPGTFPGSQVAGTIFCLNATTGIQQWNYTSGPNSFVILSPAIVNGNIFVVSGNPSPATVCELGALSGAIIWNRTLTGSTEPIDSSAPVVSGNKIFLGLGNSVFALDSSNGNQVWNYTSRNSVGSIAIANGVIYFGSGSPICAIDANSGLKLWSTSTEGTVSASSPTLSEGLLYASSTNDIYCFNASTGNLQWRFTSGGQTSPPDITDGTVYFGSSDMNVYCLNSSTGYSLWQYSINSPQITGLSIIKPMISSYSPVVNNKIIYVSYNLAYSNSSGESVPVGITTAIGAPTNSLYVPILSPSSTTITNDQNLELIIFLVILSFVVVISALFLFYRAETKR